MSGWSANDSAVATTSSTSTPIQFYPPEWSEVDISPVHLVKKLSNVLDTLRRRHQKAFTDNAIQVLYAYFLDIEKVNLGVWYRWLTGWQSEFQSFPSEILIEIFKYLGWRDVLICRGVSKRLSEISKSRPIWLSLLRRCSTMLPRPPTLGTPVELYTTQELEDLVLSRISGEIAWRLQEPPVRRDIILPKGFGDVYYSLLDGGRWLLTLSAHHRGCVVAYDLDAPVIQEPIIIISPQDECDAQRPHIINLEVDRNEPLLTFKVCIIPEAYGGPGGLVGNTLGQEPIPLLQIYQVHQSGHGDQAKLVSKRLNSFPLPSEGLTKGISLCGPHFARVFVSLQGNSCVELYDWAEPRVGRRLIAFPHEQERPIRIHLLPTSKLLCICGEHMTVYTIQDLKETEVGRNPEADLVPIFTTTLESYFLNTTLKRVSQPYVAHGVIRVAVSLNQGIYGLTVPLNGDPPKFTLLSDEGLHTEAVCIGMNRIYGQSRRTYWTASYTWPDDEANGLDVELCHPTPVHGESQAGADWLFLALMDEETGRVVTRIRDGWAILDFGANKARNGR